MFEDTSPASWYNLYKQAMLEIDPQALPGRVQLAQAAIRGRLAEIAAVSPNLEEPLPLQDALRNLVILERMCEQDSRSGQLPTTPYVALANPQRRWLEVSDGVCKLLGYPRAELIGRQIDDLAAPEWKPQTPKMFEEFMAVRSMDGEFALIHKQGHRVTFTYKARVFPDGAMIAYWYPKMSGA